MLAVALACMSIATVADCWLMQATHQLCWARGRLRVGLRFQQQCWVAA